ncbi:MAG: hypothetical protein V8R75_08655 [Oscillospiraceae bacterium]
MPVLTAAKDFKPVHEMVDLEATYDVMILKGGPGVGKNTFMREIGRTMEQAGMPVEYLGCSGTRILDGVVLPEVRCARSGRHQPPCHGASIPSGGGPLCGLG